MENDFRNFLENVDYNMQSNQKIPTFGDTNRLVREVRKLIFASPQHENRYQQRFPNSLKPIKKLKKRLNHTYDMTESSLENKEGLLYFAKLADYVKTYNDRDQLTEEHFKLLEYLAKFFKRFATANKSANEEQTVNSATLAMNDL